MGGGTGRRRSVIAGGALLALLAVVGLASHAHTPSGGGGTRALDSDILVEYALLLIAAFVLVTLPALIWVIARTGREEAAAALPRRGNWMAALFGAVCVFAVISTLVLGRGLFQHHAAHSKKSGPTAAVPAGEVTHPVQAIHFDWVPVIVVGSLLAAGLAAAAVAVHRRRISAPPAAAAAQALAAAVERTLDDLRAEPDPRRAVIAAYAQMERALADAGLPRSPPEAPREFLSRVLPSVGAGADSIERLTALFERAKFSPHDIDAKMKKEAITALELLRDELRSAG